MALATMRDDSRVQDKITPLDPVWTHIRNEAEAAVAREPDMEPLICATVLDHASLEMAIVHRVASRLGHRLLGEEAIVRAYAMALDADPTISQSIRADLAAVIDRDPAAVRFIEPVLYFKGFHAIQTHRLAHWLWDKGRKDFALMLQSRSSEVFQTDINPGAVIGKGVFLDHATGLVVGQTAVIEDNVSILQDVTLGGTGKERGDRHPKIRAGVLLGAGAKVLGNIEVGQCARIAAGSVVLHAVPRNMTVAGVPAKVVGPAGCAEPARSMDQILADWATDYTI
ncbi:serine O-acetyltransferase [Camelimonas sp. ID_303_24]